jgi:ribosomal protein S20
MPIIKSAIKRMHQTLKRRARNVGHKRNLRAAVKGFDASASATTLSKAQSEIDKAVKKNLMNKNAAARKKAQLAKQAKEAGIKLGGKKVAATATKKTPAQNTAKKTTAAKKPVAKKTTAKKAE